MSKIKLTSRGRYAVMAMVELAKAEQGQPVPLADIAKNGAISLSYLEQLISALRRHELVKSYRGPGGGYLLNRPRPDITIAEILAAAEDSTPAKKSNRGVRDSECEHTQELWSHIGEILHTSLRNISLDDVISRRVQKSAA